jgi:hypothetical protein
MQPVRELCDRDAIPAYLEATSESNRGLYLRHDIGPAAESARRLAVSDVESSKEGEPDD